MQPTVGVRTRRTADPNRFPDAVTRPAGLLFGTSLLLGALLMAVPRDISGVAVGVVFGGAWLSLVLAMTLPPESERAGQELIRRLAQFRHEVLATGDAPSRAELERLIGRAGELGLREAEVSEDLERLRACLGAIGLQERLSRGEFPSAEPPAPIAPGDVCHFVCAVRFGRRRNDQFGHMVLTSGRLGFRGALDVNVAWAEIISVRRDGRDLLVGLQDSRRILRFACHTQVEAAEAGVLAEHLAQLARTRTPGPAEYHASL